MTILLASLTLWAASAIPPMDKDELQRPSSQANPVRSRDDDDDDNEPKSKARPGVGLLKVDANDAKQAEPEDEEEEGDLQPDSPIVVTARKLDAARTQIDAALGSTVYTLSNDAIENRPGGETGSVSSILLQAPGVTLSGNGLTVRGSRPDQVRINNVIVPAAIGDPADRLSARLAETTRLITGTLPAQFGFAPAGVISVTTKNGLYQHGSQAELFAGSDGMVEPALEYIGSSHASSLFLSGSLERSRSFVADATGISARDRRYELEGLGFADHVVDPDNRVSIIIGGSHEQHRIGQTSVGAGTQPSTDGFVVGTIQHSRGAFTIQSSLFGGLQADQARFIQVTRERRASFGTQVDATEDVGASHTLRFGLLAIRSSARELDGDGSRFSIARTSAAGYLQDEWKLAPGVTFNPGVRVEWQHGLGSGATVEPRASLVWVWVGGLTAHAGYARYASAPALGEQRTATLPDERDDYLDAGVQQRVGSLTLGLDAYVRSVRNFIAERETIGSAVTTSFAFQRARLRGAELTATYAHRATTAWANFALASARGRTLIDGEALFSPDILAAAATRLVRLPSDRPFTASGGLTRRIGKLSLAGDLLVSSGTVRTLAPAQPNGSRRAAFAVIGLSGVYHLRIAERPADLRLDIANSTNARYVTGDATNLGGGWTRRGREGAITIGVEQSF